MLTRSRKAKGNRACMESDGLREDVEVALSQDSHTTVKAELLKVQSPDGLMAAPPIQRLTSVLFCTPECVWVRSTFRRRDERQRDASRRRKDDLPCARTYQADGTWDSLPVERLRGTECPYYPERKKATYTGKGHRNCSYHHTERSMRDATIHNCSWYAS
jgi:hypothetical protein